MKRLTLILLLMAMNPARADYLTMQAARNTFYGQDVWQQTVDGYDMTDRTETKGFMASYVFEEPNHNWRLAYHDYGRASRAALFGDPDNALCHTCTETTASTQFQEAKSISFAWQQKVDFLNGEWHATLGANWYSTLWEYRGLKASPANAFNKSYDSYAVHDIGLTYVAGIGAKYRSIVFDFEYTPVNAEGKNQVLGGGGAYKGIRSFSIGIAHTW